MTTVYTNIILYVIIMMT